MVHISPALPLPLPIYTLTRSAYASAQCSHSPFTCPAPALTRLPLCLQLQGDGQKRDQQQILGNADPGDSIDMQGGAYMSLSPFPTEFTGAHVGWQGSMGVSETPADMQLQARKLSFAHFGAHREMQT